MNSLVPARTLLFLPSLPPSLVRSFVCGLALVVHGGSVDAGGFSAQSSRAVVVVVVVLAAIVCTRVLDRDRVCVGLCSFVFSP